MRKLLLLATFLCAGVAMVGCKRGETPEAPAVQEPNPVLAEPAPAGAADAAAEPAAVSPTAAPAPVAPVAAAKDAV